MQLPDNVLEGVGSMSILNVQLDDMRNALRLLKDSAGRYGSFVRSGGEESPGAMQCYAVIENALQKSIDALQRKEEERRRRFDAVPVLQAMLRFKDGSTRRVAVSKPTDAISEPHIGEMFHAALVRQGVVASLETYPVLVVDKRGRIVDEIPTEQHHSLHLPITSTFDILSAAKGKQERCHT